MFTFKSRRTGKTITLLNPAEKAKKYLSEMKDGKMRTNSGEIKKDEKGKVKKLTKAQRNFRSGYLNSRKDNAKAYKYNRDKNK